ncbi:MAG: hypothetical protein U9M89_00945 [Patescibacteria group bacterium]|nr:hypothetical protein [Patescibacteria group bacterium]
MDGTTFFLGLFLLAIVISVLAWVLNKQPIIEKTVVMDNAEYRAAKALEYLKVNGEITNSRYQELTGISEAQATRDLDDLEKQGKVEQIGETGSGVTYRLK